MSELVYNEKNARYEQDFEKGQVYANVRTEGNTLIIDYVYAETPTRGTGAASEFMKNLMDEAKSKDLRVRPLCGYADGWIRRHEGYADMVVQP